VTFFELPARRPPTERRMPVWSRGPVGMVPGVVPVALLVARTDTHAVLVDGLLVYPTGFDFDLAVRRRPGFPRDHLTRADGTSCGWRSASPMVAAPITAPAAGLAPTTTIRLSRRCCTRALSARMVAMCGCGACPRPDRSPSPASGRPSRSRPPRR
jgi:hypothetical protein